MVGNDTEVDVHGLMDVIQAIATALNLSQHTPCSGRDLNRQTPVYKPEALPNETNCTLHPCNIIIYEFSNVVAKVSMSAIYIYIYI